jgi:GNAT superfamily N-acetyltransferase
VTDRSAIKENSMDALGVRVWTAPVTDVAIRTARPEDLAELRRVFREAALSNRDDAPALLARPELLEFTGDGIALGHTRVAVLGPEHADRVIGFATVIPDADDGPELDDLFVDPAWRRRGIARRLIEDAAERAEGRPISVTGNPHALAFYRALGFVSVGEADTLLGPAPRLRREPTPG